MTVEVQPLDEEETLVKPRGGKALMVVLHVLMEVPAIFQLEPLSTVRERVHVIGGRHIDVKLIVVVEMLASIHKPFRITEHGNLQLRHLYHQTVQLGKGHAQLLGAAGVQHDDIALCRREALAEGGLALLQVGDVVDHALLLQLAPQR